MLTASTSLLLRLSSASCSSSPKLVHFTLLFGSFSSFCWTVQLCCRCFAPPPLSFFLSLVARFSLLPRAEEEEEEEDAPLSDRRTRRGSPVQGGSGVEDAIANIDERCTCRT